MPLAAPPADLDAAQAAYLLAGARRVHVIGVGGSGASGLARVLRRRGYLVTGSDGRASATTAALAHEGIPVSIGHRAENVEEPSLVVASAAIPEDNAELAAARARGIPVLKYATALAAAVLTRRVIAVAGCHGKTTTTALTAFLLRRSGVDCGFVVGGNVPQLGGNAGEGRAREFVVEACEYDRSFLRFQPAAAAITNVDADHLDYYGSVEAVAQAFGEFASRIAEDGLLVTTADVLAVIGDPRRTRRLRVQTVGRGGEAEVRWMELRDDRPAGLRDPDLHAMRLAIGREDLGAFATRLAGEHNLSNAAMAIVLALEAGASLEKIRETLPEFRGVERRMEVRCTSPELTVVDDYGHHPTELRATIAAVRERWGGAGRRLVVVFQPHQHSRTRLLFDDFVDALASADRVILPDIYAARDGDADRGAVSSAELVAALTKRGVDAVHAPTLDDATREAFELRKPGDVVLVSGAGDVGRVADELARRAAHG